MVRGLCVIRTVFKFLLLLHVHYKLKGLRQREKERDMLLPRYFMKVSKQRKEADAHFRC